MKKYWLRLRRLQSVLGLALIVITAIAISPRATDGSLIFLDQGNITDIFRQVAEIGIMALAMTFVILTAGIDLSVGSVLALSASLTAKLLMHWTPGVGPAGHIALVIVAVLATAGAVGAVNGVIVARLRIQPFVVTLAAMIGVRGLARCLTRNANIDLGFGQDVSSVFADLVSAKLVVIGTLTVLAFILAVVLRRTVFGRYVRALGDNEIAARYAGLPIKKVQIAVYTLTGFMAGLAGIIHCAQNHQGSPNDGVAYELEAIAAVVIGGTSLAGGKGSIWGTIVGTLIMGVLTNIFRLRGVDVNVEMMVKAVVIIAAVWIQQARRGNTQ
jgi:ribose transport system permease protein